MTRKFFLLLILLFNASLVTGQGIRGSIYNNEGESLPFASIYIKETGSGTSANLEGLYELKLTPGSYEVVFQYQGYNTQIKQVLVADDFVNLDIVLTARVINLNTVTVTGTAEDASSTIMRKAIAKARYHLLQFDDYSAEVYIKGTLEMTRIPNVFKETLEKQGLKTGEVYTSESVSKVYFERPNTFKEEVISVRASGQDNANANPNAYVRSSFYLPKVVGSISPLSPRAFAYYRFEYQGSFQERGYEINKIKVIPRSPGDEVFEGDIYIREDFWNIHSLDLTTSIDGTKIRVQQIFAPVRSDIWMPVTQQFRFSFSALGLQGHYNYQAAVSDYEVTDNAALDASVILVDEAIEQAPEEIAAIASKDVKGGVKAVFEDDRQVSRKQFKKLIKQYEKQEKAASKARNLISDYTYRVDSLATKRDSLYWAQRRPVPLTKKELQGYQRDDSTYVAQKARKEEESIKLRNGDQPEASDILEGGYYKLNDNLYFNYNGLLPDLGLNSVEGYHVTLTGDLLWKNDTATRLEINPYLRYGFSSSSFYSKLEATYHLGEPEYRKTLRVSGGQYVSQFNPKAIQPFSNTLYALFGNNYISLFEKTFVRVSYDHTFRYKHSFSLSGEWSSRSELFNNKTFGVFNRDDRFFRPNRPLNAEVVVDGFSRNKAFITRFDYHTRPWLKHRRYNGRLLPVEDSSPEFRISYTAGWQGILDSQVDFGQIEFGLKTTFDLGVKARIDLNAEAGRFVGNDQKLFPDFKHFQGNQLDFAPLMAVGGYRLLDYYRYSTGREYASVLSHIRFRKFLFTQLPALRFSGLKENLFVNYLSTPGSNNYTELGYTIDNILRILRVEFVQSFQGWKAKEFGLVLGLAIKLGDNR